MEGKGVKSNDEAVRGLCEQVQNLYDTIEKVAATVKNRVNSIPHTSPDRTDVETKLRGTKDLGLVTRIDKLKRWVRAVSMIPSIGGATGADKPNE